MCVASWIFFREVVMHDLIDRYKIENSEDWRKWSNDMPKLSFNPDWQIKVIPPFGGAIARFLVFKGENRVSVYFDANGVLGAMDEPYWEAYPIDGDAERFLLGEEDAMLKAIERQLSCGA